MKSYKVIVFETDSVVYETPAISGFEAARQVLIEQLLVTAENDWTVDVEHLETILPTVEVLTEEQVSTPVFLGQYVHVIADAELDIPEQNL